MSYTGLSAETLRKVIDRAVLEERERCAKIADQAEQDGLNDECLCCATVARDLAALIRAPNDNPTAEEEIGQTRLSTLE